MPPTPKNTSAGIVTSKTESSVKLEGKAKGPPTVTVHVYHLDEEQAAQRAVDLFFDTTRTVQRRWQELEDEGDD